jgi:hypothetical protein
MALLNNTLIMDFGKPGKNSINGAAALSGGGKAFYLIRGNAPLFFNK